MLICFVCSADALKEFSQVINLVEDERDRMVSIGQESGRLE